MGGLIGVCPICGKEFKKRSGVQKYCGDICSSEGHKLLRKSREKDKPKNIGICAMCGKEFIQKTSRHKYCSPDCSAKADKIREEAYRKEHKAQERSFSIRNCLVCGKEFKTYHHNVKCCSEECKAIRRKEQDLESKRHNREKKNAKKSIKKYGFKPSVDTFSIKTAMAKERGISYGSFVAKMEMNPVDTEIIREYKDRIRKGV